MVSFVLSLNRTFFESLLIIEISIPLLVKNCTKKSKKNKHYKQKSVSNCVYFSFLFPPDFPYHVFLLCYQYNRKVVTIWNCLVLFFLIQFLILAFLAIPDIIQSESATRHSMKISYQMIDFIGAKILMSYR